MRLSGGILVEIFDAISGEIPGEISRSTWRSFGFSKDFFFLEFLKNFLNKFLSSYWMNFWKAIYWETSERIHRRFSKMILLEISARISIIFLGNLWEKIPHGRFFEKKNSWRNFWRYFTKIFGKQLRKYFSMSPWKSLWKTCISESVYGISRLFNRHYAVEMF